MCVRATVKHGLRDFGPVGAGIECGIGIRPGNRNRDLNDTLGCSVATASIISVRRLMVSLEKEKHAYTKD